MANTAEDITAQIRGYIDAPASQWPAFTGGQATAYQSIVTQLNGDLRSPSHYPPLAPSVVSQATQPDSVSASDWAAVTTALTTALTYETEIHNFFDSFRGFVNAVYVTNVNYLSNTAIPEIQAATGQAVQFAVSTLISVGGAAAGDAGAPGADVVSSLVGLLADYVENSADPDDNSISTTINGAASALSNAFNDAITNVQTMEQAILANPESIRQMGQALQSAGLSWPNPDDAFRGAAIKAYSIGLWQAILPAVWHLIDSQDDPTFHTDISYFGSYIQQNPNYYLTATPAQGGYEVTSHWLGRGTMVINAKSPGNDMCNEIFNNLGVSRADLFNEQNGWSGFTRETFISGGGCVATQFAAAAAAADPASADNIDQQLAALRVFRTKLQQSAMGTWYVSVYDAISDPVAQLYNSDPLIKQAIGQYDGQTIYKTLIALLTTGTFPQGIDAGTQLGNALAILSIVQSAAGTGSTIDQAADQILNYTSDYENVASEDDLLNAIAAETPPAATFSPQ